MQELIELKTLALNCGFSQVGDLDVDTIELRQEARDACATNKCRLYGKHWSCPPGCGTLEECSEKLHKYKKGLILQTTGTMEDSLDLDAIMDIKKVYQAAFDKFITIARNKHPNCLIMADINCRNCVECTYPDKPCRFPDDVIAKMEGFGMIVSDVCAKNNMKYYYGGGTLTYIGCVLVE